MIPVFQVQKQISVASPFPLATERIGASRFANPAEVSYDITTSRILHQIGLNFVEHIRSGRTSQLLELLGECPRLDVYHYVGYTTE